MQAIRVIYLQLLGWTLIGFKRLSKAVTTLTNPLTPI
jgi:hypothetical protein